MLHRRPGTAVLLGFLLFATGCWRGVAFKPGPPSVGDGVEITVAGTKGKNGSFVAVILCKNHTNQAITLNREQTAVVGPDGRDAYFTGGSPLITVPAQGTKKIKLVAKNTGVDYKRLTGVYLRFDGIWAGTTRINVPPMALGTPTSGPGQTNSAFTSPNVAAPQAAGQEVAAAGQTGEAPAATGGGTVIQYTGPRQKVKTAGLKCAAMPLQTKNVKEAMRFVINDLFLTELQAVGFEAIGPDDINAMVGFERVKDAVGCDKVSCVVEIGNALGVPYLAAGSVVGMEGQAVVTLKLYDVANVRVLSRSSRIAQGEGQDVVPRIIAAAVQELVTRSGL